MLAEYHRALRPVQRRSNWRHPLAGKTRTGKASQRIGGLRRRVSVEKSTVVTRTRRCQLYLALSVASWAFMTSAQIHWLGW